MTENDDRGLGAVTALCRELMLAPPSSEWSVDAVGVFASRVRFLMGKPEDTQFEELGADTEAKRGGDGEPGDEFEEEDVGETLTPKGRNSKRQRVSMRPMIEPDQDQTSPPAVRRLGGLKGTQPMQNNV